MNASPAERWGSAAAIALVLLAAAPFYRTARAQGAPDGAPQAGQPAPPVQLVPPLEPAPPVRLAPPLRLGPPAQRERTARPATTAPADEPPAPVVSPVAVDNPLAATPTQRTGSIEVDTLASVDPDSVGLLDSSQGGFGADLWEGTDKALVERLLPKLASATPSRFSRALTLRLLLSRAPAPRGSSPRAPGGAADSRSLLTLRIERLLALAEVESAVKLLRLAPAETAGEAHARVEVDSLLYQNDFSGACTKVRGFVREYRGSYWQQANAFCLALEGDYARSSMVADILREREADVAPAFFTLVDALGGDDRAVVDSLPDPGALKLAMMRAANRRLPDDSIASGRPDVLRAVSLSPNAGLDLRLDAAERAFVVGAITAARLAELYGAVEFSPDQLANPLSAAQSGWGPRARALLLRAAAGADQPTARAEILRRAWDLSRERGGYAIMVGASAPVVAGIAPAAELVWFAADAAKVLFGAGMTSEAMAWYRLAERDAAASANARAVADSLWPLAQIADDRDEIPWRPDGLAAWLAVTKRTAGNDQAARRRALMVFSVLQALGKPVGPDDWTGLLGDTLTSDATIPDPALWHALDRAAERRQIGLTVLLTLLALGDRSVPSADPLTVTKAIAALRTVGLAQEARALGLEAVSGIGG